MTRTGGAGARFRQRKLSTKVALAIVREDQVDRIDDDAQRNIPKVDTGVEKGEEVEHHLQAAISASQAAAVGGKVAQIFIPTPDTIASTIQYGRLYPLQFPQPATYIRFSSTVEDCSGCPYCLSSEDDVYLKSMNRKNPSALCSEDQFEELMNFFEETAQLKQPYAAVDCPPVVSYDEMEASFDDAIVENAKPLARGVYEHWKSRRLQRGNKPLMLNLKFETGQDTDDADPYVCFRRREVRQVRKTRGRDAQSTEKLKKLRKELEDARQLMAMVRQREMTRRDMLAVDRQLFEQRAELKRVKRTLGIRGDDEDLINQKRRKTIEQSQGRQSATQLRSFPRTDGRAAEADLVLLHDLLAEKENDIAREINQKIRQHKKWNEGWLDFTRAPLTPRLEESDPATFRSAVNEYLPTPPASVSSEPSGEAVHTGEDSPTGVRGDAVSVRYASPTSEDASCQSRPSFRRRVGRGGRLMIDRRGMQLQSREYMDSSVSDRYKYDQDEEDDRPLFLMDSYDLMNMRYRASYSAASQVAQAQPSRRAQQDIHMMNGRSAVGHASSPPQPTNSHPPISPSPAAP
ncbi:MAG: Enhancer of polycomb-like protein 1 [Candelina submexicana]|nr:MAG: Enhancer of polycomb-like protein 1 [Candelina submexicana]